MPELGLLGFVRGAHSNVRPYRDHAPRVCRHDCTQSNGTRSCRYQYQASRCPRWLALLYRETFSLTRMRPHRHVQRDPRGQTDHSSQSHQRKSRSFGWAGGLRITALIFRCILNRGPCPVTELHHSSTPAPARTRPSTPQATYFMCQCRDHLNRQSLSCSAVCASTRARRSQSFGLLKKLRPGENVEEIRCLQSMGFCSEAVFMLLGSERSITISQGWPRGSWVGCVITNILSIPANQPLKFQSLRPACESRAGLSKYHWA